MTYSSYMATALEHSIQRALARTDNGEFMDIVSVCTVGAESARAGLFPDRFVRQHLWCTGSQRKDYGVRMMARPGGSFWQRQLRLFRDGVPAAIVTEEDEIRSEYEDDNRYLAPKVVDAVIEVATEIEQQGWAAFRDTYLCLPADPETEALEDWLPTVRALDSLPWVGPTSAWYLLRNLLGAKVFKPDTHILAIAWHFFGEQDDPLAAMAEATRTLWPSICEDQGVAGDVACPHLGVVDFILWWHRRETGEPSLLAHQPPASYC